MIDAFARGWKVEPGLIHENSNSIFRAPAVPIARFNHQRMQPVRKSPGIISPSESA